MVSCAVAGCKNRPDVKDTNLRYYIFPKDEVLCEQWVSACGKSKAFKIECARICSRHFIQSDFNLQDILLKIPENKRRLKNGAVPSINLPNEKKPSRQEKKRVRLENKRIVEECLASYEKTQQQTSQRNLLSEKVYSPMYDGTSVKREIKSALSKRPNKAINHEDRTLLEINRDPFESVYFLDEGEEKNSRKRKHCVLDEECTVEIKRNLNLEQPIKEHSYSHIKFYTNGSTQTEVDFECCKELHIMRLEAQNRKLKALLKKQLQRAQENEDMRCSLRKIMTMGQINRLLHPGRNLKWKAEDIASAMSLYKAGPVAYEQLRKKNYPLPSSSTLRGWAVKIQISPGFLENIFQLMTKLEYTEEERLCVLCLGKMKLKASTYSSENVRNSRAKFAHIVMVRGLTKDWTQILYYDMDAPMTANILNSIILKLEEIRFIVTAVSSDMGPTLPDLLEQLQVSENQPFFCHPHDECRHIFFFTDVLSLMKLLRNRYINSGFVLYGTTIDTEPIKEIINAAPSELPISREHIDVGKLARHKANLATQLLSNAVSAAIKRCISNEKVQSPDALQCADFIQAVSDWFEVFNSKSMFNDSNDWSNAFGLSLAIQNSIIALMSDVVRSLKARKKQSPLRFQNLVLINNAALPQMLSYLKRKYNIKCILTDRLNHAELENFFDVLRSKCGPQNHPTPLEFKYRLRSSVLGKMIF